MITTRVFIYSKLHCTLSYVLNNIKKVSSKTFFIWFLFFNFQPPAEEKLNGELLGYSIGYRVAGYEGVDSFTITKLDDLVTQYQMSGLPLFTKYEVKIAADNKAGRGPWTDSKYVETLQGSMSLVCVVVVAVVISIIDVVVDDNVVVIVAVLLL